MKSYKVSESFYLNEIPVKVELKKEAKPKHQYIIIDRSGSMWGNLDNVLDVIVNYVDKLPEGSKVSLGWFSGYSEYGLSVPYELKKEKQGVVNTVNSYRYALGCTNFTEILQKINKDSEERQASLFFFTDGYHNCGPFSEVIKTLKELKDNLEVSVFVGCGYINRDNMNEMAAITNGGFVHLNSFTEFSQALDDFMEGVQESNSGVIAVIPEEAENICSILGKNIISYEKENNEIRYKASNKKKQVIYCTSSKPLGEEQQFGKDEVLPRTIAYYLIQHNKTPEALKILDILGDKYYIRKLYNTFTQEEYASVENEILKSIFDSRKRYKEGKVVGYLPSDNAFCVLDALDIISNDDTAIIHLNDKEFEYHKTSIASEQQDGSKLEYPKDIKASANNLKYHDSRLNLNLNVMYKADVCLDKNQFTKTNAINEDLSKYGLKDNQKYPVNCIRNYNIILDGKLNTPKLVLSKLSKNSIVKLTNNLTFREDGKYVIDLSSLPLINKGYLTETSAMSLADKCWEAQQLSTELSVLKYLIGTLKIVKTDKLDEDLETFLADNFYIKNGSYQPPKTSVESTDEYLSYEFSISFKGYSKPTASSVIKKIITNGKLTEREKPVKRYYEAHKDKNLENLQRTYEIKNVEYKELQKKIQHAKFAIILVNRGSMPEFSSRENMNLNIIKNINGQDKDIITNFNIIQKPVKI